jgi:hypothetical protein
MLLEDARDLTDFERRFVAAANRLRCSFCVVKAAQPGESIDFEDVLTGRTCRVVERTASKTVRPGGLLYARVVTLDGESIMLGCGVALLKPTSRTQLADAIREATGRWGRYWRSSSGAAPRRSSGCGRSSGCRRWRLLVLFGRGLANRSVAVNAAADDRFREPARARPHGANAIGQLRVVARHPERAFCLLERAESLHRHLDVLLQAELRS